MSVDSDLAVATGLAERDSIKAYRTVRYLIVVAEGKVPTPGYEVTLEQSPLDIHPQQYNLVQRERPGIWPQVETPYRVREIIIVDRDQKYLTVHHAGGTDEVQIVDDPLGLEAFARVVTGGSDELATGADQATGFSANFKFDEAFSDALANLPRRDPKYPDELIVVRVVEAGAMFGGIAGFHDLFVTVERS